MKMALENLKRATTQGHAAIDLVGRDTDIEDPLL